MGSGIEHIYTWWIDGILWFIRYFLFAGLGYLILFVWFRKRFRPAKIQAGIPPGFRVRKEVINSIRTLVIYSLTSWIIFQWYDMGITTIYTDISQFGYLYFSVSIVLMIIIHDAYFYWTHRFMHLPVAFGLTHKTHHLSHNPSPWAAFSFDTLEAIISVGFIPIIVFLLPTHPLALFLFLTYMVFINVLGHLGYEMFPLKFRKSKIGRWHNTSTNHNLHHRSPQYNFGLYFTFWDRIMGTYRN